MRGEGRSASPVRLFSMSCFFSKSSISLEGSTVLVGAAVKAGEGVAVVGAVGWGSFAEGLRPSAKEEGAASFAFTFRLEEKRRRKKSPTLRVFLSGGVVGDAEGVGRFSSAGGGA